SLVLTSTDLESESQGSLWVGIPHWQWLARKCTEGWVPTPSNSSTAHSRENRSLHRRMEPRDDAVTPPPEVQAYYARFPEESRLGSGSSRLEFERTKEILTRVLPPPPARIVDVGGAAGAYSLWLAEQGYEVHLVDASARLVEVARKRSGQGARQIASLSVADARSLPHADAFAAAVLVMAPLYHPVLAAARLAALR